jgi:hypothetical protein
MSVPPSSCPRCSAPLLAADEICPFCGYRLSAMPMPDEPSPAREAAPREREALTEPSQEPVGPALDVETVATEPPPWERWRQLGFFTSLWLTWRDSVFRPVSFFRRLPPRGGYGSPLGFAVIVTVFGLFFSFYWSTVEEAVSGALEQGIAVELIGGFVTLLFGLALLIPLYVGLLFASVAVIHVGFLVVGASRRGYGATFRAVAYASSPAAFSVFPFFGPLLGLIWGMVLIYVAVREVQRTTNGRATLGFLIPFLAVLVLALLLSILLVLALSSLGLEPAG